MKNIKFLRSVLPGSNKTGLKSTRRGPFQMFVGKETRSASVDVTLNNQINAADIVPLFRRFAHPGQIHNICETFMANKEPSDLALTGRFLYQSRAFDICKGAFQQIPDGHHTPTLTLRSVLRPYGALWLVQTLVTVCKCSSSLGQSAQGHDGRLEGRPPDHLLTSH